MPKDCKRLAEVDFLIAALLLAAGATQASEKDAEAAEVAGKVASLELKDDGAGTLIVLVKRPARVPLPPREMTFQVTKETKFLTAGGPGEEGTPVGADRLADVFKKSADVTVRYQGEGDQRIATTVTAAAIIQEGPKPPAADEGNLKRLFRAKAEAARKLYDLRVAQYRIGVAGFEGVAAAGRQLIAAELRLLDKKEDRVSACEKNLERCAADQEGRRGPREGGRGGPGRGPGGGMRPAGRRDFVGGGESQVAREERAPTNRRLPPALTPRTRRRPTRRSDHVPRPRGLVRQRKKPWRSPGLPVYSSGRSSLGNRNGERERGGNRFWSGEIDPDMGVGTHDNGARLIHHAAALLPAGANLIPVVHSRRQGRGRELALFAARRRRFAIEENLGVRWDEDLHTGTAVRRFGGRWRRRVGRRRGRCGRCGNDDRRLSIDAGWPVAVAVVVRRGACGNLPETALSEVEWFARLTTHLLRGYAHGRYRTIV